MTSLFKLRKLIKATLGQWDNNSIVIQSCLYIQSNNTDYLLRHTQLIVCAVKYQIMVFDSKIIGHYFLFSLFKFFGWKKFYINLKFRIKSSFLFCLIIQFYLMYRPICQKPVHFLSAQNAFFQAFIACTWYVYLCCNTESKNRLNIFSLFSWHYIQFT